MGSHQKRLLWYYTVPCVQKRKNGYQSIITVSHASSKRFQSIELDKSYLLGQGYCLQCSYVAEKNARCHIVHRPERNTMGDKPLSDHANVLSIDLRGNDHRGQGSSVEGIVPSNRRQTPTSKIVASQHDIQKW